MRLAPLDDIDRKLIRLLCDCARQPVTSLSHATGISRASVYARIDRLEKAGVIKGYTVLLGEEFRQSLVCAHVMVKLSPKHSKSIEKSLTALPQLVALHAISGAHDMIAVVEASSTADLNRIIDQIGDLQGVESTMSSILLDTKVSRASSLASTEKSAIDAAAIIPGPLE